MQNLKKIYCWNKNLNQVSVVTLKLHKILLSTIMSLRLTDFLECNVFNGTGYISGYVWYISFMSLRKQDYSNI